MPKRSMKACSSLLRLFPTSERLPSTRLLHEQQRPSTHKRRQPWTSSSLSPGRGRWTHALVRVQPAKQPEWTGNPQVAPRWWTNHNTLAAALGPSQALGPFHHSSPRYLRKEPLQHSDASEVRVIFIGRLVVAFDACLELSDPLCGLLHCVVMVCIERWCFRIWKPLHHAGSN